MYTDLGYARKRLEDTLVRLKDGTPYWVESIHIEGEESPNKKSKKPLYSLQTEEDEEEEVYEDQEDMGEYEEEVAPPSPTISFSPPNKYWEILPEVLPSEGSISLTLQGKFICNGFKIKGENNTSHSVSLDGLDLTPVPLGFCNLLNTAVWVSRKPVRKYWRQGLGTGNTFIHDFNGKSHTFPNLVLLAKTIRGEYPSLDEARSLIGQRAIVAFHRHFAIGSKALYYKNKEVGCAKDLSFNKRYDYLSEYFYEEVLNGNGSGSSQHW
jgi:hypothetical protein